jgi:anti-anti-sigma factor
METRVEAHAEVTVIRVSGSVDGLTAPELQDAFGSQLAQGRFRLVAALEEVDYTSSAGLRALLGAMKEARSQGGDLRLAGPQPDVLKVLSMSGFASILKIFDNVDQAVASFAS